MAAGLTDTNNETTGSHLSLSPGPGPLEGFKRNQEDSGDRGRVLELEKRPSGTSKASL